MREGYQRSRCGRGVAAVIAPQRAAHLLVLAFEDGRLLRVLILELVQLSRRALFFTLNCLELTLALSFLKAVHLCRQERGDWDEGVMGG